VELNISPDLRAELFIDAIYFILKEKHPELEQAEMDQFKVPLAREFLELETANQD
jgi:hypothetical protein